MSKQPQASARERPRRSTRNRPTDEQMLDAALRVFGEVGVERATMEAVAEEADTTKMTLYAHFGSRDGLIGAVADRELELLTQWMFESYDRYDSEPPKERTRAAVEVLFDWAIERPDGFRFMLNTTQATVAGNADGVPTEADPGRRLYKALEPRVAERFRAYYASVGQDRHASADIVAAMVLSMSLDTAHQAVVSNVPPEIVKQLVIQATLGALQAIDPAVLDAIDTAARSTTDTSPSR